MRYHSDPLRRIALIAGICIIAALTSPLANTFAAGGKITGTVTDPKGAVVRGASVVARDPVSGQTYGSETDKDGRYEIDNIAPGAYVVTITAPGFSELRRESVEVQEGGATKLDVRLEIAPVEAGTVTVSGKGRKANSDPVYQQLRAQAGAADDFSGPFATVHNLVLKRDAATFTLADGEIYFLKPVEGRITGAVFLGTGELRMEPPIEAERHSLELFTKEAVLSEAFDHLTLRFTDKTFDEVRTAAGVTMGTAGPQASRARDVYHDNQTLLRKRLRTNMELRALADIYNPERPGYFVAFIGGRRYNKLVFQLDPLGIEEVAPEEVTLSSYGDTDGGIWTAFHLADEYRVGSATGAQDHRLYDITKHEIDGAIKKTRIAATDRISLNVLVPGTRVLPFALDRSLRVSTVQDEQGRELDFIQEPKNDDADFAVILPDRAKEGQSLRLTIGYDGNDVLLDAGSGNFFLRDRVAWYPNNALMVFGDRAVFDMTFRFPKSHMFIGTGALVEPEKEENGLKVAHWSSGTTELAVAGFNYGLFKKKEVLDKDTGYNIEFYANSEMPGMAGRNAPGAMYTTGAANSTLADAQNATRIYTAYFGKLPYTRLALTQQPAPNFGQAWPTLIYMPFTSFLDPTQRYMMMGIRGATDKFWRDVAPHEIAHQWWGHVVGWDSYRDQWMSEGFAEFSASLFLQLTSKDLSNTKSFLEFWEERRKLIVEARPQTMGRTPYKVGPLTQGVRLSNSKTGGAYRFIVYPKGAYVLHMVRMMMWDHNTGDERFQKMMKDFVTTNYNKNVSTEDFKRIIEKHMTSQMDLDRNHRMDWFFNEYVYGTEMPSYDFTYQIAETGGRVVLSGRITQSGVSDRFCMVVPVYADFGKGWVRLGSAGIVGNDSVEVKGVALPSVPKRVAVAAMADVLALKIQNSRQ